MCDKQEVQEEKSEYRAYLLRLWRVSKTSQPGWRASLERSDGGQLMIFATLGDLFTFLESQTATVSQVED